MKKIVIIGIAVISVVLLSVFLIAPVFAQDTSPPNDVWQDMYQACQNGDWQGMNEAMQRVYEEGSGYGACHGNYSAPNEENTSGTSSNSSNNTGDNTNSDSNILTGSNGWSSNTYGGMMGGQGGSGSGGMMGGGGFGGMMGGGSGSGMMGGSGGMMGWR